MKKFEELDLHTYKKLKKQRKIIRIEMIGKIYGAVKGQEIKEIV